MADFRSNTFSGGAFATVNSNGNVSKEDSRLEQLLPSHILQSSPQLEKFLKAYYDFMNLESGFTYIEYRTYRFTTPRIDGVSGNAVVTQQDAVLYLNNTPIEPADFGSDEVEPFSGSELYYSSYLQWQKLATDPNMFFVLDNNRNVYKDNGQSYKIRKWAFGSDSDMLEDEDLWNAITVEETVDSTNKINDVLLPGETAGTKLVFAAGSLKHNAHYFITLPITHWVPYTGPSRVLNSVETAMDVDEATDEYINLMQKELAPIIPNRVGLDKRSLLKKIVDFYLVRGTDESIETFFRIFFEEDATVAYPWDNTFVLSASNWNSTDSAYDATQGHASDNSKYQDSDYYQKYSYVVKTKLNQSAWENSFDRLVHPSGMKYFGEIALYSKAIAALSGDLIPATDPNWLYRSGIKHSSLGSQMPSIQQFGYQGSRIIILQPSELTGMAMTAHAIQRSEIVLSSSEEVNAGDFVTGTKYRIATTGDTDFTLVGADNSDVGTVFTATGAGSGTGTADDAIVEFQTVIESSAILTEDDSHNPVVFDAIELEDSSILRDES